MGHAVTMTEQKEKDLTPELWFSRKFQLQIRFKVALERFFFLIGGTLSKYSQRENNVHMQKTVSCPDECVMARIYQCCS